MSVWEILCIIIVSALVIGFTIAMTAAAVSKIIDAKASAQVKITTNVFRNECEYLDKLFDKYMARIEQMIDKVINKETSEPSKTRFGD